MSSATVRLSVSENLRFAADFQKDAPDAFTKWHARTGPTFKAWIPGHRLISSTDAAVVRHGLDDTGALFSKGRFADDLSPFWGRSTVQLADGADWARQRPICSGFFHQGANKIYERAVKGRLEPMIDGLRAKARAGKTVSLYQPVRDVCHAAACDVWFPSASEAERAELAGLIRDGTDIASQRMLQLLAVPLSWPTAANRRYRRIAANAHALAERIIARARAERSDHLLGVIASSIDAEPARALSSIEARNNFLMFMVACYEWPTLGWLLFELSTREGVRKQAIDEVRRAIGPASDAQPALPYLEACIKETFRLRPPAPLIARTVIGASKVNGVKFEVGQSLVIPVKAIQRDPVRWDAPEEFRPDRFIGQRADPGYLAFGMGPRGCIGQGMAMRVMQTAVAGVLAEFDFEIVGAEAPRMHDKLKSYPQGGVPVRLHHR